MNLRLQRSALSEVNSPSVARSADLTKVLDLQQRLAITIAKNRCKTYRSRAGIRVRGEGQVVGAPTAGPREQDRL